MTAVLRNRRFTVLLACCAAVVGLAAGCGGSSSSSNVAVVDGQQITKAAYLAVITPYLKSLGTKAPKPGTDQYKSVVQKVVQYLVSKAELEQQAKKLGITMTPKDIDAALNEVVKKYFKGSRAKLLAAIRQQHSTLDQVRQTVALQTLQSRLSKKLTAGITVTDKEALDYYNTNIAQYKKAASRDIDHILVKDKALAESIYKQLQSGASFAALAKKYSIDPGSKNNGGKLGVQPENGLVPPFAKVAFALPTGVISRPVKSKFGWHIIKPVGPVIPASQSPFSKEKAAIVTQLRQAKQSDASSAFQRKITNYYATRVKYSSGFAPPTAASASTSAIPTTG